MFGKGIFFDKIFMVAYKKIREISVIRAVRILMLSKCYSLVTAKKLKSVKVSIVTGGVFLKIIFISKSNV